MFYFFYFSKETPATIETASCCASAIEPENTFILEIGGVHAVVPLTYCPHLTQVCPLPSFDFIDVNKPCKDCNSRQENWICLTCHGVFCSRFVNSHMVEHFEKSKHPMVLSFSDLSIWCYACDAYVENEILNEAKASACKSKFGE
jgi:histone deacetylase 6